MRLLCLVTESALLTTPKHKVAYQAERVLDDRVAETPWINCCLCRPLDASNCSSKMAMSNFAATVSGTRSQRKGRINTSALPDGLVQLVNGSEGALVSDERLHDATVHRMREVGLVPEVAVMGVFYHVVLLGTLGVLDVLIHESYGGRLSLSFSL